MDFLNFPDLTTDVLGQAFSFLLGRLSRVLDGHGVADPGEDEVNAPAELEGEWRPIPPDPRAVEAQLPRLRELAGTLSPYERNPDRVSAHDPELLDTLAHLRYVLETVYGQRITFRGEDRAPTGTRVVQVVDTVSGEVVGVEGGVVGGSAVEQRVVDVRQGGSVVGVRADEVRP